MEYFDHVDDVMTYNSSNIPRSSESSANPQSSLPSQTLWAGRQRPLAHLNSPAGQPASGEVGAQKSSSDWSAQSGWPLHLSSSGKQAPPEQRNWSGGQVEGQTSSEPSPQSSSLSQSQTAGIQRWEPPEHRTSESSQGDGGGHGDPAQRHKPSEQELKDRAQNFRLKKIRWKSVYIYTNKLNQALSHAYLN